MYQENSALNSAELEAPFMLPLADGEAMDDGFTDDIDGLRLDFPQIKVPGGGMLQWELPTGDPQNPDYTKYLDGVILFSHNNNAYWPSGSEYDSSVPPICQSLDGKLGYGNPGGTCVDCLLNQYGSSESGAGKACKNMRTIYLLRSGEFIPLQINLPPTSLKAFSRFVNAVFVYRRRRIFSCIVRLSLTRATNARTNQDYSVVSFAKLRDFTGEELAQVAAYANDFIQRIKQMNQQRASALRSASALEEEDDGQPLRLPENGAHFADARVIDGEREKLPA